MAVLPREATYGEFCKYVVGPDEYVVAGDHSRDTLVSIMARRPPKTKKGVHNQIITWRKIYYAARKLIETRLGNDPHLKRELGKTYYWALDALGNVSSSVWVTSEQSKIAQGTPMCFDFHYGSDCTPARALIFDDFTPEDDRDNMRGRKALTSANWRFDGTKYTVDLDSAQTLMLRKAHAPR